MGPVVDAVQSDEKIPAKTSVVVIGGGIAGSSTALFLADKGISVVLCEKGHIAGEQSSRNWGWVTARNRDMRELPLCLASANLWKDMNEFVGAETGYRRLGSLRVYDTDESVAVGDDWLKDAQLLQIQARFLNDHELQERAPGASRKFRAALYAPNDGRAEPQKAAPAIVEGARRRGAKIFTQCAVRGLDVQAGNLDQPSPFEAIRVLDPPATEIFLDRAQQSLIETFPHFAEAKIAQKWPSAMFALKSRPGSS